MVSLYFIDTYLTLRVQGILIMNLNQKSIVSCVLKRLKDFL